ncbi:DNRLRE domain-containing protein [bacterium]|nr:DNRLRE domain-containing protein [bacterium]
MVVFVFCSCGTVLTAESQLEEAPVIEDTWIYSKYPGSAYNDYDYLSVGFETLGIDKARALILFDITEIPQNADIESAVLSIGQSDLIYTHSPAHTNTFKASLHRIKDSWNGSDVSWENRPSQSYTPISEWTLDSNTAEYNIDVTEVVQIWTEGEFGNYGFMIEGVFEAQDYMVRFYSNESSHEPVLRVRYRDPTPLNIQLDIPAVFDVFDPDILNVSAIDISWNSAKIVWDTNEPATSIVVYAHSPGEDDVQKIEQADLVYGHNVVVSGLNPETTYYYRVESEDENGNKGESEELSFTTAGRESGAPVNPAGGFIDPDPIVEPPPDTDPVLEPLMIPPENILLPDQTVPTSTEPVDPTALNTPPRSSSITPKEKILPNTYTLVGSASKSLRVVALCATGLFGVYVTVSAIQALINLIKGARNEK